MLLAPADDRLPLLTCVCSVVKEITQINLRELEGNGAGSWHDTYKGQSTRSDL